MYNFKVGEKVSELPDNANNFLKEYVILKVIGNKVLVEDLYLKKVYGSKDKHIFQTEINIDSLVPLHIAKTKLDQLTQEFKTVENQVKDKLEVAAAILEEAHKFTQEHNITLNDMYDATKSLFNVMNNIGWRTSSFNC